MLATFFLRFFNNGKSVGIRNNYRSRFHNGFLGLGSNYFGSSNRRSRSGSFHNKRDEGSKDLIVVVNNFFSFLLFWNSSGRSRCIIGGSCSSISSGTLSSASSTMAMTMMAKEGSSDLGEGMSSIVALLGVLLQVAFLALIVIGTLLALVTQSSVGRENKEGIRNR